MDRSGGKETTSKFRSVTLGNVTLQSKNERFRETNRILEIYSEMTPSPFVYHPKKYGISKYSRGGKMGRDHRQSFIDNAKNTSYTPGPGNYQAPTEFGHYRSRKSVG